MYYYTVCTTALYVLLHCMYYCTVLLFEINGQENKDEVKRNMEKNKIRSFKIPILQ
jgi:hypothetical protein